MNLLFPKCYANRVVIIPPPLEQNVVTLQGTMEDAFGKSELIGSADEVYHVFPLLVLSLLFLTVSCMLMNCHLSCGTA